MKVLAINSSPHRDKGNTALILNPFLKGMKEAGAEVEIFYANDLKINPCKGDFSCWIRTPGRCIHDDDMTWLLPKVTQADITVWASPIYCDGVTGTIKNLMERLLPMALPYFEIRDGHIRHPGRDGVKLGKIVLVSNCGFWERDNFDPLLAHFDAYSRNVGAQFAGALLRPHGPALAQMIQMGAPVKDVLEAAREAGSQLVRDGRMSLETLDTISRDLLPRETYIQMVNGYFREELEKLDK